MNNIPEILPIEQKSARDRAASMVGSGGLIAFPTDTVYGIGVSPFQSRAIDRIYQVKGRSHLKAIPILLADLEDLEQLTPPLSDMIQRLIDRFWPGPLTLILPLLPSLPENISPTPTIGLRIPDHKLTRTLLRETGPLAATSANLSGKPPALTADEVLRQLADQVNLILDGGESPGGTASTVVDCTEIEPRLLREGPLSWEQIRDFFQSEV